MTTQSEQFDQKLRSELYLAMLKLQGLVLITEYAEKKEDADMCTNVLMEYLHTVPEVVDAYFKCIEGSKGVSDV